MIRYFNQIIDAVFVAGCKGLVFVGAVAFYADKVLNINIFKIF